MDDGSNTKPVDIGDNTNESDDETQETGGVESASTKQTKKRKLRSDVWTTSVGSHENQISPNMLSA